MTSRFVIASAKTSARDRYRSVKTVRIQLRGPAWRGPHLADRAAPGRYLPNTTSGSVDSAAAEDRPGNKLAEPIDRPTVRRILIQSQMRPDFIIIAGIPAQVDLSKDDDVIEAFTADRVDQSLPTSVLGG